MMRERPVSKRAEKKRLIEMLRRPICTVCNGATTVCDDYWSGIAKERGLDPCPPSWRNRTCPGCNGHGRTNPDGTPMEPQPLRCDAPVSREVA